MSRHVLLGEVPGQRGGSVAADLEAAGFRVTAAQSSLQFLQICRREAPDALILDTGLPWHSPAVVCRILRSQPQTAGTPLLVVAPPEERPTGEQCLEAGADRLLERPVDGADLVERLKQSLGMQAGA